MPRKEMTSKTRRRRVDGYLDPTLSTVFTKRNNSQFCETYSDDDDSDAIVERSSKYSSAVRRGKSRRDRRRSKDTRKKKIEDSRTDSDEDGGNIQDSFERSDSDFNADKEERHGIFASHSQKTEKKSGGRDLRRKAVKLKTMQTTATKYLKNGDYKSALELFDKVLGIYTDHYWNEYSRIGAALHNLGIVHRLDGNLDDALDAIQEAVRVRKLALGEVNVKVGDSLVEMGIILNSRKEFHDALRIFNEAMENCKKIFLGERGMPIAKILNNVGCVHFESGNMPIALKNFEDALDIQRSFHLENFEDKSSLLSISSTLSNIGYVQLARNEFDDAIVSLEEVLSIQQKVFDEDNKSTLDTLDNLGYASASSGNLDDAMKYYEELLEAQEASLGHLHIDCAETMRKIVFVQMHLYEWEEGREKVSRMIAIQRRHLNKDDARIVESKKLLSDLNYLVLRFPSPKDALVISLTKNGLRNPFDNKCLSLSFLGGLPDDITRLLRKMEKPHNRAKTSGHKIAYS